MRWLRQVCHFIVYISHTVINHHGTPYVVQPTWANHQLCYCDIPKQTTVGWWWISTSGVAVSGHTLIGWAEGVTILRHLLMGRIIKSSVILYQIQPFHCPFVCVFSRKNPQTYHVTQYLRASLPDILTLGFMRSKSLVIWKLSHSWTELFWQVTCDQRS